MDCINFPGGSLLGGLEQAGLSKHLISKGHSADAVTTRFVKLGAMKVILSVRRPEDAIASWMDTFGFSLGESIAALDQWMAMYRELKDHALVLRFETIEHDPFAAARSLANYVCPDASSEEVDAICRHFTKDRVLELCGRIANREGEIEDVGFSFYDKATFFHRKHVTALGERRAADRITSEQIACIRPAMAPHCDERGELR